MPKKLKDYPPPELIQAIEKKPQLTAAEQAQVDQFLAKYGFQPKKDD